MADVIGCQQKSAGPICIFGPDYANTRDTAKQQSYQQLSSAIRCDFDSALLECFADSPP